MSKQLICAGHLCVDLTPTLSQTAAVPVAALLQPGRLTQVGPVNISLGGSVPNTGLALKRLGNSVRLMGKIGQDALGELAMKRLDLYDSGQDVICQSGVSTSYSIVLAVPGTDRIFLHHPGANDSFSSGDIDWSKVTTAALFHFGYPPLMQRMFADHGEELLRILRSARLQGAATSLDMAAVDPDTPAGRADWYRILKRTLPYVDFFLPSAEELAYMLDPVLYAAWQARAGGGDVCAVLDVANEIKPLADLCLQLGCKLVLVKCGAKGMYLTTAAPELLAEISPRAGLKVEQWGSRQLFEASYVPDRILSTAGAGDTSIAAFLTALLTGYDPVWALHLATATGAVCITELDALSGLKPLPELAQRIRSGWTKQSI